MGPLPKSVPSSHSCHCKVTVSTVAVVAGAVDKRGRSTRKNCINDTHRNEQNCPNEALLFIGNQNPETLEEDIQYKPLEGL